MSTAHSPLMYQFSSRHTEAWPLNLLVCQSCLDWLKTKKRFTLVWNHNARKSCFNYVSKHDNKVDWPDLNCCWMFDPNRRCFPGGVNLAKWTETLQRIIILWDCLCQKKNEKLAHDHRSCETQPLFKIGTQPQRSTQLLLSNKLHKLLTSSTSSCRINRLLVFPPWN